MQTRRVALALFLFLKQLNLLEQMVVVGVVCGFFFSFYFFFLGGCGVGAEGGEE